MKNYDTLSDIVNQLEKPGYTDEIGHKLECNAAFISLRKMAENEYKNYVRQVVCEVFALPLKDLFLKTNVPRYANARYVYWGVLRAKLGLGPSQLSIEAGFSHSIVSTGPRKLKDWYETSSVFRKSIDEIANRVGVKVKEVLG